MDKLEKYLDQVCRSVGGPRSLRQHLRQELHEHLQDAVAQHRAAGLSEEEACARALAEFGRPEEVRSELEATHGQRLLPVLIAKAMQWKEMTMRAKWLWMSWAHLALAAVVLLEVLFLTFLVVFIVPRFNRLLSDGAIDAAELERLGMTWMPAFANGVTRIAGGYATWWLLLAIAVIAVFEWRVRSENKPWMRLAALGSVGLGLMLVLMVTAASLVIPFCLGAPATGRLARAFGREQVVKIDAAVSALEQAGGKDWGAIQEPLDRAAHALVNLATKAPVLPALSAAPGAPPPDELRARVQAAEAHLVEAREAVAAKDTARLGTALVKFRQAFEPVREAAQRLTH
jgi:hypothetical protein